MAWIGVATTENDATIFRRYCSNPTKLPTSVTLVGIDRFMMASIFVGYILCFHPPIMYPKYTNDCRENSHFLRLASS
jgi:hypothetical protein